jgi:hypothetical protein
VGGLYPSPKGIGGIWSQPGGPGTPVYPQQQLNPTSVIPPFSTAPVSEYTGQFVAGCGHWMMEPAIQQAWSDAEQSYVKLVC